MSGFVLHCELEIPVSIAKTFAVFEDPYNLAKITPPDLGFEILTKDLRMGKGAEIDYQFRWFGIPLKWRTVISEYGPPHLFVDEALRSPYRYWKHRHTFEETAAGTLVTDRVSYGMPFGPFGRVVHEVSVRAQLLHIFRFRQKAIGELLGVKPLRALDPHVTETSEG